MGLVTQSKSLVAANPALICASQTPGAAGYLTLTAPVVMLDSQRRVLITSAANLSNVNFLIIGTRDTGQALFELLAGPNAGTAQSVFDYRTITSIAISGTAAGALTVGTSGVGSTDWKLANYRAETFSLGINTFVSGTVTYSIETTNSRILLSGFNSSAAQPVINVAPTSVANATASAVLLLNTVVHAWRMTILSGTGSVAVEAEQSGY